MNKHYAQAIQELQKVKEKNESRHAQNLKEGAAAIIRTFGDEEMKNTFTRLTTFKAGTTEIVRYEKVIAAINVMMEEFRLKYNKEILNPSRAKSVNLSKRIINSMLNSNGVLLTTITIILSLIGGAYLFGVDRGSIKFDKEKLDLVDSIKSLKQKIVACEEDQNSEINSLRINDKNYHDTFIKMREELDSCKRLKK